MRHAWRLRGLAMLLVAGIVTGLAWGETLEMVTYYPAPGATAQDLHVRSLTVGLDYAKENPGDGEALIFDRLGIGTANPGAELDVYAPADAVFARLWGASDGDNFSGLELRSEQGALGPAGDRIWQLAHKQGGGAGEPNDFHLSYNDGAGWFQRLVVNAAGQVGIGTASPISVLHAVSTAGDAANDITLDFHSNVANSGGEFSTRRSRGTPAAPTAVANGDDLGGLTFVGHNGTNFLPGAVINPVVDGAPNAGGVPTSVTIETYNGVSLSPRFHITAVGNVGIGTLTPQTPAPNAQPANLDANDVWVRAANGGAGQWVSAIAAAAGGGYDGEQVGGVLSAVGVGVRTMNIPEFSVATRLLVTFTPSTTGTGNPSYTVEFRKAGGAPLLSISEQAPPTANTKYSQMLEIPRLAASAGIRVSRGRVEARLYR